MAVRPLAAPDRSDVAARRPDLLVLHVPWHRIHTVVDITADSGSLLSEVLAEHAELHACLMDLTGNVGASRDRLMPYEARVEVQTGDLLGELPQGADYYLLPAGIEDLDTGRLMRLMRSVSAACLPSGRTIACLPTSASARLVRTAERAGLEITRRGGEGSVTLVEFGTGLLRALPEE